MTRDQLRISIDQAFKSFTDSLLAAVDEYLKDAAPAPQLVESSKSTYEESPLKFRTGRKPKPISDIDMKIIQAGGVPPGWLKSAVRRVCARLNMECPLGPKRKYHKFSISDEDRALLVAGQIPDGWLKTKVRRACTQLGIECPLGPVRMYRKDPADGVDSMKSEMPEVPSTKGKDAAVLDARRRLVTGNYRMDAAEVRKKMGWG